MMKKFFALLATAALLVGVSCSSATGPVVPDKVSQASLEEFFNSFDLSNPAIAEYTITDYDGNVLGSGVIGRDENGN